MHRVHWKEEYYTSDEQICRAESPSEVGDAFQHIVYQHAMQHLVRHVLLLFPQSKQYSM